MDKPNKVLAAFNISKNNTGSVIGQVIMLSSKIASLSLHLKKFSKDLHSKKGFMSMVNKRKRFLKYIKTKDSNMYFSLINALELRK